MANLLFEFPHPFGGMCMRSRPRRYPDPRLIMMDLSRAPFMEQFLDDRFGVFADDTQKIPTKRPRNNVDEQNAESKLQSESTSDQFQVSLDVNHFHPNELSVKTVDNTVVVRGRHEERRDQHGFISREFTRRYVLPSGVEPENVTTSLSPEGVLVIRAPKFALEPAKKPNERSVPITTTSCCDQGSASLPADQLPTDQQPTDQQPTSLSADQQENADEPSVETTDKME